MNDVFGGRAAQWAAEQEQPWVRLRFAVVAETLRRTLHRAPGPLRVLDVGGGDGADDVPLAGAGHDVTVLDPSTDLLQRAAGRGLRTVAGDLFDHGLEETFDVVLCHNLLHYLPDVDTAVDRLGALTAPGGVLSLMCPNPAMDVLSAAVRRLDPDEALALLNAPTVLGRTFDHPMNRLEATTAEAALERAGFAVEGRFGIRCVLDLVAGDEVKHDPEFYAAVLRLELAVCDRDPYRRTARFWQLTARSGR